VVQTPNAADGKIGICGGIGDISIWCVVQIPLQTRLRSLNHSYTHIHTLSACNQE